MHWIEIPWWLRTLFSVAGVVLLIVSSRMNARDARRRTRRQIADEIRQAKTKHLTSPSHLLSYRLSASHVRNTCEVCITLDRAEQIARFDPDEDRRWHRRAARHYRKIGL